MENEIRRIIKEIPSVDGVHTLKTRVYLPEGEIKGYLHVVHGMTEHIDRYVEFMTKAAKEGYVTFGYNHLGHGDTARDDSELGYIAKKDGWRLLVADVANAEAAMKKEYGDSLPLYLLGHSMGSFIVRLAAPDAKPDKLIVMGTGGPNPAAGAGIAMANAIKLFRGDRHVSPLIENTAFGKYNERFDKTRKYDWLSKDQSVQDAYAADKFCTFHFTVSAMKDLVVLNKECNSAKWFKEFPKDMPVFLVSGSEDPVGSYGKGVETVYEKLKEAGADVRMKVYENCRHEILNEALRDEVACDIFEFIKG